MISFRFVESVDSDYQDFVFKNYYDELLVGRSRRCHLVLEDPDISSIHFKIFIENDNLLVATM